MCCGAVLFVCGMRVSQACRRPSADDSMGVVGQVV